MPAFQSPNVEQICSWRQVETEEASEDWIRPYSDSDHVASVVLKEGFSNIEKSPLLQVSVLIRRAYTWTELPEVSVTSEPPQPLFGTLSTKRLRGYHGSDRHDAHVAH